MVKEFQRGGWRELNFAGIHDNSEDDQLETDECILYFVTEVPYLTMRRGGKPRFRECDATILIHVLTFKDFICGDIELVQISWKICSLLLETQLSFVVRVIYSNRKV